MFQITKLVVDVNNLAIENDSARVGYFRHAGYLMDYAKSEFDDDIKPQIVISICCIYFLYER